MTGEERKGHFHSPQMESDLLIVGTLLNWLEIEMGRNPRLAEPTEALGRCYLYLTELAGGKESKLPVGKDGQPIVTVL